MKLGNPHMYDLMKKYSDARDKNNEYVGDSSLYWKGVMHTLKNMLDELYPNWTTTETGSLIWKYNTTYAEAYTIASNSNSYVDQI